MMEAFFFPLYELLLRGGKVDQATVQLFLLVFGAGCWVAALLVFFLDGCVAVVRGRSFLGYRHEVKFSIIAALLMLSAAGVVGMIGLAIDVLQPSRAACIAVGIAWPSLMTVLMGVKEPIPDDQEEEDVHGPDEGAIG